MIMTVPFNSDSPAVAAVNGKLTAAGHDLATDAANPAWYAGLHRQRAEQVAFALLPEKHHRDTPRLMAEHLHWLGRVKTRYRKDGWHWRYDTHERLARALCCAATDTIKKTTAELRKHDLIDTRKAFAPGTNVTVTHYRLTDEAHVILGLLTLSGISDLTDAEWLDLVSPTDPEAKPLRDVLKGWQAIKTPEAVDAMQAAITAGVERVQPEGFKALPRVTYEAWRKTVKAHHPASDPGTFGTNQRKRLAVILKDLKQAAADPGAAFKYTGDQLAHLMQRLASSWPEFQSRVKTATGKTLPDTPDLDAMAWHLSIATQLAFGSDDATPKQVIKAGW
ncbi:hypothetical protein EOJ32_10030 [Paracoccus sp. Arc7-R13]|uniref:hypothetical protein n=1 Tax=Paracoccus sp. Arc7-R13 TaxID=2500532 RepID=UPI000FDAB5DF|nr:hypothetical protein [Paracoccus sp. Arc7-R13]AZY93965.1 hypothetical protein EOJ32_10030 [Paracoccus sp. Arc7-R13]